MAYYPTLRRIMKKCPDEAPSPTTSSLPFVTSVDLRDSIRLDISSAFVGLHSGEWKTATVLESFYSDPKLPLAEPRIVATSQRRDLS
jgi:hypothetical protein